MKSFNLKYLINAPKGKVWEALVDPKIIKEWGGGPVKMKGEEGFDFSLWGGDIWGKNTKVVKNKLLVQDWFGGRWAAPSKVTFELKEKGSKTLLALTHSDLPEEGWEDFVDGWNNFYLGPLKTLLEK